MKPQNQVTVRSSETGDVFRISRGFAERHLDTLTILDDLHDGEGFPVKPIASDGGYLAAWFDSNIPTPIQSAEPVDPIAAPVADDK